MTTVVSGTPDTPVVGETWVGGTTIVDAFRRTSRAQAHRPALRWRLDGGWASMTWAEYSRSVTNLATGLRDWGLRHGDRVGILSGNRPEWHVADIGAMAAGLVTVPIYQTNAASQVGYVLAHSGARACFVENTSQLAKVLLARPQLPALEHVVVIDESAGLDDGFITPFAGLLGTAAQVPPVSSTALDELVHGVTPADVATIVYTSGTTGPPRGAVITHANVIATLRSLLSLIEIGPDDRFLSFLPLSHITERTISNFAQVACGSETWFARSVATVVEDLQACRPTILFAVPRLWEKFQDGIVENVAAARPAARLLGRRYLEVAGRNEREGDHRSLRYRLLDRVVGRTIRSSLGLDRLRMVACGAAPVHPDLLHWFHAVGVPIAEGYGQTEVALCTSVNTPGDIRIGSVGRPIPGVSVVIAPDGEILVRGDNVCAGYWQDPLATAELIDADGWMHSGDLGHLDADGFLHVTGRKKDLIITSYGKNISPEALETALRMAPLIAQAVVIGDDRPYLTALVSIDAEAAADWAAHRGRSLDLEALSADPDLVAEIDQAIAAVNAVHSHAEGIKRWRVLPRELTIAGGELTPTLKVKRNVVVERWADLIDEMYAGS